jgi:hypothetical protein
MSKNHRKIYENYHGVIPQDDIGRTYEIHHLDGNHANNHIDNLKAVTIQEHYDIHREQNDWGACFLIMRRMMSDELPKEERIEVARKAGKVGAQKMLEEGRHNFQILDRSTYNFFYRTEEGKQVRVEKNKKMYVDGTNKFFDSDSCKERQKKIIAEGRHNLYGGVTCRDMNGKVIQVKKEIYSSQSGSMDTWQYVAVNSKEGKKRKMIQENNKNV